MSSLQRRLERCRPSAISFWAPLPMTRVTLAMPVRAVIWRCFRHSRSVIQGTQQGRSRCPSGASPDTICSAVCSAIPSVLQAPCQGILGAPAMPFSGTPEASFQAPYSGAPKAPSQALFSGDLDGMQALFFRGFRCR